MRENKAILPEGVVLHERYKIHTVLGQGGFGVTYKGEDLLLHIPVAIKEYFPADQVSRNVEQSLAIQWSAADEQPGGLKEGSEDFLKEARKMARLHEIPGIVRVRDTFYENRTSYIVMDFVKGITLKHYLQQNGTMQYEECLKLMAPLMKSMGEVHKQGLIHRDISPDNIVVREDGTVCLLDLGAARDMTTAIDSAPSLAVAKRGFSPAEQYAEHAELGSWTDVYAFCATIYYCIYGKLVPDALARIERDTLSFPLVDGKKLPQEFVNMLWEGLSVDKNYRIRDMNQLYARSEPFIKEKLRLKPQLLGGAAAALVVLAVFVMLGVTRPWIKSVELLGSRNGNLLGNGWFNMQEGDYECFVDHLYNLHFLDYDTTERAFLEGDEPVIEDSNDALYINTTEDRIFFEKYNYHTDTYQMLSMEVANRQPQLLFEQTEIMKMVQYARLSDGKEYLYYLLEAGQASYLYRYDIEQKKSQKLSEDIVFWFNLYEDAIYYTALNKTSTRLCTSRVDGSKPKVLNDSHNYSYGLVEDDRIILISITDRQLEVLDLEGNVLYNLSEQNINIEKTVFTYEDSWIYYAEQGSDTIRKCFYDGSRDQEVYRGITALHLCIAEGVLWIAEGSTEDGIVTQAYTLGTLRDNEPVAIEEP